ncbi:MAG: N-acyl-D-amino-acid deacylase, partial [Pyrococcus sp.]|uniref:N-acyl-D-amino-acid deacylase family protein n=1 Tax=Pyrococcus sp. TaxID=33866 RepID=UPI00258D4193
IKDGKIVKVGKIKERGEIEINAKNLIATPGFIDIHNHSDVAILANPSALNYIMQGVTTIVTGNCGLSAAPLSEDSEEVIDIILSHYKGEVKVTWKSFKEYVKTLDKTKKAINIAPLVGHNTVRAYVLGIGDNKPTSNDLNEMKELVRKAMEAGAFGMSTGLIYDPGVFANTEEIIELAKVVSEYGGIYASHIRNESDLLIEATLEAIKVGKEANVRVEISHHKASGRRNWGLVKTTLALMEYYRRFGVEVTCDVYPYTFASTGLFYLFPPWTRERGLNEFLELLQKEEVRKRLRTELARPSTTWENILLDAGFEETIIAYSEKFKEYEGDSLLEVSQTMNKDPYEIMFDLIQEDPEISVIVGGMSEEDVKFVISHRLSMIGSDGSIQKFGKGHPHPRSYGTFPRVIAKYVREEKILPLEVAIKKMTYMPAWKLGLKDRGLIKEGFVADIVLFDFWTVKDTSTFTNPHAYSEGIKYVMVNGEFVVKDGICTGNTPGIALKRT